MRTPMQWSATTNAGFSTAPANDLVHPVLDQGPYSFEHVNVTDQRRDGDSLLVWFERMLHTRLECEEIGIGDHTVIPVEQAHVLVHRADAPSGSVMFVHNLADQPAHIYLPEQRDENNELIEVFSDREYDDIDLRDLKIDGYGYRWIRLRRTHSRW
jgi:maltose alpha-D-glucosyltransferase/alpha-amylase